MDTQPLRLVLGLSLLGAALLPACATEAPMDELAGDSDLDGEVGKGDTADAFTYFLITPDARACSFGARCGGYFVERPNRATTECAPGESTRRCYVDTLDLEGTALPADYQEWHTDQIREGKTIIVRGDLVADEDTGRTTLAATEVWLPPTTLVEPTLEGTFVLAKFNGNCDDGSCPWITEMRLNGNRSAEIGSVDLQASAADLEGIDRGYEHLFERDGIIAVGERAYGHDGEKIRTANLFWTKSVVLPR